jgi:hypothetical protein
MPLTEAGYAVLTAANGKEALRVCELHAGTIDLILRDVISSAPRRANRLAGRWARW